MIKKLPYFIALAAALASPVYAQVQPCVSNGTTYLKLSGAQIQTVLVGSTACNPATGTVYINQEFLTGGSSGTIGDYKKGPSDPIDPTQSNIGSYSISTGPSSSITYNYSGESDNYAVFGPTSGTLGTSGAIYDFCPNGNAPPTSIRVNAGTSSGC